MIYCPMASYEEKYSSDVNYITSAFEIDQFRNTDHKLGEKYGFYIDDSLRDVRYFHKCIHYGFVLATNWLDEPLGIVTGVRQWTQYNSKSNTYVKMRSVTILDVNGKLWRGKYAPENADLVIAKRIKG